MPSPNSGSSYPNQGSKRGTGGSGGQNVPRGSRSKPAKTDFARHKGQGPRDGKGPGWAPS